MIDHALAQPLLNDLVDGDLDSVRRESVEAHLQVCDHCSREVEFLLELRAGARALPREIAPSRDLWSGIAERLEPRQEVGVIPIQRKRSTQGRSWRGWVAVAVAASVLIVVTSAVTMQLTRGPGAPTLALAPEVVSEPDIRATTSLAAFEPTERELLTTVARLEMELRERSSSLSPETRAVVDENLRIIDLAIAEIRTALEADSTSVELPLLLTGVYRAKVDLLESTVRLYSRT
jgi:anti-sigma-K factor RskA